MSAPAIGIDLGTTHCCLAVFQEGRVLIIPDEQSGDYTIPSYVYIDTDGEEVVGRPAKEEAFRKPENTFYDLKRILGRNINDPELQNDMKFWPFTVKEDEDGIPKVCVNGELFFPEQISAKILAKLKSTAEEFLSLAQGSIKKAVITVPAYFSDGQRQATVDAGELAGLEVLTILNEPTAAAIAFAVENKNNAKSKKILVFDLGGGTFDIAVLDITSRNIDVLAVNGDTHLGGEDFDKKLMEHCASVFKAKTGIDMLEEKDSPSIIVSQKAKRNLRRLQTYCEQAKKYLASGVKTNISVDVLVEGHDLFVTITREEFEELNKEHFKKTIDLVDATLIELNLSKNAIDEVVLVGGSTRIPKVKQLLGDYFPGKLLNKSIHPDQAVAYGAAVQAAIMTGEKSLGSLKFEEIRDVTPMALGTELSSMELGVTIPRNTKIPTRKTTGHVTVADNQRGMTFKVYQGNDLDVAANNKLLGTFDLDGIPPKKAGKEKVDVTMEINSMGILHVQAVLRSDKKKSSSITVKEDKKRMSESTKKGLFAKMESFKIKSKK